MVRVRIIDDVFGIVGRLKSIDSDYAIYYNQCTHGYELHCMRCRPTMQLVLPFERLDIRCVDYVLSTRIAKAIDKAYALDEYNAQAQSAMNERIMDEAIYKARNAKKYLERGGSEIPPYGKL